MAESATLDLERDLNAAQRAAACAGAGAHLVVAGAGSGKTRTLVYRVAYLVSQGVAPESILLLTFTRRAAQEMLRRAAALLDERCRRVAGGTFHAFAYLVLRRYGELLGYGDGFTILDRGDAADLVGLLRSEGGFARRGRRFPRKDTLLELFSKSVNTGRDLAALLAEDYPQFADDLADVERLGRRYAERKKAQNVMDYDDLLVNLRDLLVEHAGARRQICSRYRHVLVDEYQDTNRLQAHIAALLASAHGNLMVVGDEAQSIYGFRGASFANIIDFPKVFPDARTTLLEQNYRSIQPILDLGNAVLARARQSFGKRLYSELPGDDKPLLVRTDDEHGQARFVAERVLELREEGVPLAEMAVLVRAAWHTNALEIELGRRNVPFRKYGGLRFVEAAHVKDLCALLKLGQNPTDAAAWHRFLQLYDGIGPTTAQRLAAEVIDAGGDLAVLARPHLRRRPYGRDLARLKEVLDAISRPDLGLAGQLEHAVRYYQTLLPQRYDDAARRQRDLGTLEVIAERYDALDAFLSDLAIDPPDFTRPSREHDPEDEHLTLSTVHSAKGLEWRVVFVLNLVNGYFPSFPSFGDAEAYEEERRLFYVAVTRAQRRLYLLKPEVLSGRGGYRERVAELSAFLAEIDLETLTEERLYSDQPPAGEWLEEEGVDVDDATLRRIQAYFGDG
ncbi:MAG: ATP-dependent helicase [Acidobacteria bacterium]|nr:MAG: ATP-dependent helicase [Acidobacteriota bacterium]